ncbi:trimeric intracellular cation channel family protein [Actinocrinis sp.]|uniref:trimeric intracellular cation channel family protein n=1 Tax=Actinocrinis sp. TaxID=1920516 RepID=UPI002D382FF5|nr:TRIC cation channel family protein [Actinocrinis sp.]HZP50692.1 TRIC cation channel family protein [Actinocrinis sp.]
MVHLPILFDLLGVFSAAASGALTAVRKGLDLVGILVLGAATGLGGGAVRDVLIGARPPAFLADWRYLSAATIASLAVIAAQYQVFAVGPELRERARVTTAYLIVDSLTLGFFAVSGTGKALRYGLAPVPAALMGVLTAVGGGVIRDMLIAEVPTVLRREFYAIPAAIGSLIVVGADRYTPALTPIAFVAAGATAALRLIAVRRHWHAQLPPAKR